ncbi:MAG: endonuclease/exonuclease/phosphatase family protein [Victivallaceae bacterium]|nr:endonuclease/exonuclease/phosphatase family protein [Victivallaceae bacterium]
MEIKNWLLSAAAAVLCGCAANAPASLLSYNIQIGLKADRETADLNGTAEAIRRVGAETVVLNEVDKGTERSGGVDQPAFIAGKLGYHYEFGFASPRPGGEYGNVIMSEYPLERLALIDLPSNAIEARSALVVKVLAPEPYYVVGTHLTYDRDLEEVRVRCVGMITDYMKTNGFTPFVLMGDLNARPDSHTVARLRELGYLVVNDIAPEEKTYPAGTPRVLLDYTAVYPADAAKIVTHFVVNEPAVSDHRPLYSEIVFQR